MSSLIVDEWLLPRVLYLDSRLSEYNIQPIGWSGYYSYGRLFDQYDKLENLKCAMAHAIVWRIRHNESTEVV